MVVFNQLFNHIDIIFHFQNLFAIGEISILTIVVIFLSYHMNQSCNLKTLVFRMHKRGIICLSSTSFSPFSSVLPCPGESAGASPQYTQHSLANTEKIQQI